MAEERIALVTGSYDPITAGHMYLIRIAAGMFDRVYVTICANTEKAGGAFLPEDRVKLAKDAVEKAGLANVEVLLNGGLVSDIARAYGAKYLVRGVRNGMDFAYEYDLAGIMKRFDPALETIFLPTDPTLACISATYVRDLLKYGCPLGDAVPNGELTRALYRK
ncbi:MAG: pantetheine-phosphate adenylyltransferase [Clostridia bacterium]|nr:pantetheine-phosphate adenylyltransferase [Clostridia bacterium]